MNTGPWRLLAGITLLALIVANVWAETRKWTDETGRTVVAELEGVEGSNVLLKLPDGRVAPFPIDKLSEGDRAFIESANGSGPKVSGPAGKPRVPIDQRQWPDVVEVDTRSIEIDAVKESVPERSFIYESAAFEFTSQAKLAGSVMKEVARTFEATRSLVSSLPWGIVCEPPDGAPRYKAALYETREDYFRAGGPTNSGGVYMSGEKIFKIPFPSLGLEMRGKTYFMNDRFSNDTLVHELTHQMMHDYLPFLPKWVIEGSAEYTELLPYNAGTFRAGSHKTEVKRHIDSRSEYGFEADLGSVEAHLTMTRQGWEAASGESGGQMKVYFRSLLLVYYFCHLDGDGDGRRFLHFMDAVRNDAEALIRFFADPRVKRMPGGRFSYPSSLEPPDMDPETAPFKHLDRLLDGRTYEQLATEIVAGFKSIGEKVEAR
jgi:hypothetical protein